jgi:peptidyl-prolyl cis-trans isomerase B (cyclophilin B)
MNMMMLKWKYLPLLAIALLLSAGLLAQDEKRVKVLISTDYGDMVAELYNETPGHRDNFVKLIKEGWYKGSPFHRVIKDFMIQGGHNADGRVDPGYTIPAEFNNSLYHKKGALAAARMGDQVNPMKESSGCQFYIVQGKVFDEEMVMNMGKRSGFSYSEQALEDYSTIGGTPHLDGGYTVFGQVVSGLDVIDKIAGVPTGPGDVPLDEIKMNISIVE